ncbi:MAG: carbohydrate ABC transporter permease [Burkholderiales bacterium]|nr:carbohydrate ABC transporter permease [Burkholderiales bacterium]MDE1928276.1 carbohydrate ABC transporter permease [Burkholderiales bacterium]MDE2158035.1 carbohydrate ABC transporter permease [Burkholderiales bacterium]MDE2504207.1 carbohydrate ABC transporter permease [Burkholderiales bacterium]
MNAGSTPLQRLARAGLYALLVGYSLLTLAPFAWAVLTSFKTMHEIALADHLLPASFRLDAYRQILGGPFTTWFLNSLTVAAIVTVLGVVSNTLAGYALARLRFVGRNGVFQLLMIVIMVPAQVTMIPAFLVVARLGLADTHMALVLTSVVSIASIFMMRQFFVSFPAEVEEAARLDGCGPLETFVRIVLPMAVPALATQAIFTFMAVWNEFMKPLLYISSVDKYMLTQGLNAAAKQYEKSAAWNLTMAGSVISIIPILLIYIVLNKYFITLNDRGGGSK